MPKFPIEIEERRIMAELKKEKKYPQIQQGIFYRFLVFLMMCLFLTVCSSYTVAKTWKCKCGYENYVEMRYCGVCGRERGK
jgi:hypothetical protein